MAGHIASSGNLNWNSPHFVREGSLYVFDGKIDLDPCSNDTSVMGAEVNYKLPQNDGLKDAWNIKGAGTRVYFNPPFGNSYMKPDRSDVIGAKEFGKLKDQDAISAFIEEHGAAPILASSNKKERALAKKYRGFVSPDLTTYDESFIARLEANDYATPRSTEYSVRSSIYDWVSRAVTEWEFNEVESIGLLPAAVDTKHWQKRIFLTATAACFIRGRIRFLMPNGEPGGPAPMACALVYWGGREDRFFKAFSPHGTCLQLSESGAVR